MWSLFAPLGKPSRFPSVLYNYWKCATLRQSSRLTVKPPARRPWTAEDDRKLRSLVEQGFGTTRIASEMSDRSFSTIEFRLEGLKAGGRPLGLEGEIKTGPKFTAEEKALMLEKRGQGLSHRDIASYFPNRSLTSVRRCLMNLVYCPPL
jgi:hypothetical protein